MAYEVAILSLAPLIYTEETSVGIKIITELSPLTFILLRLPSSHIIPSFLHFLSAPLFQKGQTHFSPQFLS